MTRPVSELRERVRRLPGMDRLLPALEGLPPAYLVGGAVRDLLRGADSVDLDLAVEGDTRSAARELATRLGGSAREHERFGTAAIETEGLAVDLAATRRETYQRPGDLPRVEPASLAEDLGRRGVTINAMAVGLTGDDLGHLYDPFGGLADLREGAVRVLHELSFVDDPTRLLRALRYEARLGMAMDSDTERLAREAADIGALRTVSGPRIRDALMGLLAEHEAPSAVARLRELGLDRSLHKALNADPELVASASLGAAALAADPATASLAALISEAPGELGGWLADLNLHAPVRDAVARAARNAPLVAMELRKDLKPSEIWSLLRREPAETLALAMAVGAPAEPVLRFATELRPARLEITGDDLLAAGVPPSPAVGRALEETLRRKLDGEVSGRDEELRTALELAGA